MSAESDRIRAIITSQDGELMPNVARFLAFETNETVESCMGILAAAKLARDEYIANNPQLAAQEAQCQAKAAWNNAVAGVNGNIH